MTLFVDLRASANGGIVADAASVWEDGVYPVSHAEFAGRVNGRSVLFVIHGFNVDRESGLKSLSNWAGHCALDDTWMTVGVLWPGDSVFLPVIDYVVEGVEAIASGKLLASFLNATGTGVNRVAFASHSLGARVLLETARHLARKPDEAFIMAGAIENDCLEREYADSAKRIAQINTFASRADSVLKLAFPAGNLIGEIIMHGHPYDRTALGRSGPARPLPDGVDVTAWQIPDPWDYGHLDYFSHTPGPAIAVPVQQPGPGTPPAASAADWKSSWSAAAVATLARQ